MSKLFHPSLIRLKNHPEIIERTIQDKIAEDPSILGLGDLILKDKERMQPRAGRLDLLLQDPDGYRRYEIEIQLGKVDESHIIRTIEYWDIERKRYPQYDHCAVIIAEDITSRFLNVIGLFNGFIPLIAIQMNAYTFGDDIGLVFTKIMSETIHGSVEEEEAMDVQESVTTREDWIKKWKPERIKIADELLALLNESGDGYQFMFTKLIIAFTKDSERIPFARLVPRSKNQLALAFSAIKSEDIDAIIETNALDDLGYNARASRYRIRISEDDLNTKREVFKRLFAIVKQKYSEE